MWQSHDGHLSITALRHRYILFFGPCIFIIEGRTDQRNAQINFFTHTIEKNNSITYLDLNIQSYLQHLSLSIYRKPTQTDTTIHYTSNHPDQHKMAATMDTH